MADVNTLSDAELATALGSAERELVTKRFDLAAQRLQDTSSLRVIRRRIARIHTEARRREIAGGLPKGALGHAARVGVEPGVAAPEGSPAERGGFLAGIVDRLTGKD